MIPFHMKKFSVKPELLAALRGMTATQFTVDALTKFYLSHTTNLHSSKKAARQFIYRNMQKLIKSDYMERLPTEGRWPWYRLSEKFRQLEYSTTELITTCLLYTSPSPRD